MATIQQSIDIRAPAHTAYNQLTQFESYPLFMGGVQTVRQIDDTHLHWKTRMADQWTEWDAEITEQQPDRCIAWHDTGGAHMGGRVEVQAMGPEASRVVFTLESDAQPQPGPGTVDGADEMSQRLLQDLTRLKSFIEKYGETGAWRGEIHGAQVSVRDRDARAAEDGRFAQPAVPSPAPATSYAAGSEGWEGGEDPSRPVTSAAQQAGDPASQPQAHVTYDKAMRMAAARRGDSAGSHVGTPALAPTQAPAMRRAAQVRNDSAGSVAHRRSAPTQQAGQAPQADAGAADALAQSLKEPAPDTMHDTRLRQSIERAVPPSEPPEE